MYVSYFVVYVDFLFATNETPPTALCYRDRRNYSLINPTRPECRLILIAD